MLNLIVNQRLISMCSQLICKLFLSIALCILCEIYPWVDKVFM